MDSTFTQEHVFPESIGGNLIINEVCKNCNDFLGTKVDCLLVDMFPIKMIRAGLEIKNKSGKLPTPLTGGFLLNDPALNAIQFYDKETGTLQFKLKDSFKEIQNEDGSCSITFSGNEKDFEKLLEKIAERKGTILETKEETIIHKKPKIRKEEENFKFSCIPCLLKIAYSLGYYWLGEKYLEDKLGKVLCAKIISQLELTDLDSTITALMGVPITFNYFSNNYFNNWTQDSCSHIAILKKIKKDIVCFIRIFNIIEARIIISYDSKNYPDFQDQFLLIDTTNNRKVERLLMQELNDTTNPNSMNKFTIDWVKIAFNKWEIKILKSAKEVSSVLIEL